LRTLFEESKINGMTLKNRLVRSATWENMADAKGHMTEKLFRLYQDLAKGGVGMIITGYAFVTENEQPNPGMMGIYQDSFIDEYRELTEMVHAHGSRIVLQIAYGGSQTTYQSEGRVIWGASDIADLATKVIPTPMTREDISTLVQAFGSAAARAKEAGFDGVQFHGAHSYLLSQFLSPHYNRRSDEYGGSLENRARIFTQTYDEIRRRVGSDFLVLTKVHATDFVENGATFEECRYVCQQLAQRGIDAIEISGGSAASGERNPLRTKINSPDKEAYHAPYAAKLAAELSVPIIVVGGIRSPEVVEQLLEATNIAYFALSRPLLTEPDLPRRWQQGDCARSKCISCNGCQRMNPGGNVCVLTRRVQNSASS
jgi:2,4-dienoyl-CoA reductase-like NADH-dependent reductase (Old Yellow Enzyme family)